MVEKAFSWLVTSKMRREKKNLRLTCKKLKNRKKKIYIYIRISLSVKLF